MDNTKIRSEKFELGRKTREQVLGSAHVSKAEDKTTPFDAPFQDLITESAWGSVWSRDQWTRRERSMVTIALLAALGHIEECAMHVRAAENTGASREDICEAMLHVAIYAGVPSANSAIKAIKAVFEEIDNNQETKNGENS